MVLGVRSIAIANLRMWGLPSCNLPNGSLQQRLIALSNSIRDQSCPPSYALSVPSGTLVWIISELAHVSHSW